MGLKAQLGLQNQIEPILYCHITEISKSLRAQRAFTTGFCSPTLAHQTPFWISAKLLFCNPTFVRNKLKFKVQDSNTAQRKRTAVPLEHCAKLLRRNFTCRSFSATNEKKRAITHVMIDIRIADG